MRKLFAAIGVLLVAAAAVWRMGIAPGMEKRFPEDWQYSVDSIGVTSSANEQGQFPAGTTLKDDPISISERNINVAQVNADGSVLLVDNYKILDAGTRAVTWEFTYEATVNSVTGKHVDSRYADDYFFFPPNTQKTTYHVRNSSYQGLPLTFQNEEVISELNTYHYSFKGDLDDTASFPDMKLEADQRIICFDFEMDYWVEPITGEVVKYHEWCEGDWVVNTKTGEKLSAILRWGNDTSGDDIIRRSAEVRNMLNSLNLNRLYIPLALAVMGLVVLAFGLAPLLLKQRPLPTVDAPTAKRETSEVKVAV